MKSVVVLLVVYIQKVLSCYDNPQYSRYCLSYWQQRYCLIKRNFMLQNCPRTCGFCSVSGGKQCRNEASNKDCSYWQRSGYCTPGNIYYQYMQRNCKHSCGFCWTKPTKRSTTPVTTTTTTTTMAATAAKSCQNSPHYNKQCPDWKEYCRKPTKAQPNEYYQFMKDHCKKECNFPCDDKDKNENGNKEEEDGKSKKKYKINEENCGIDGTSKNSSTFVVAGADAIKNKWRWQVALYYFSNFFCGGSLITPLHVLTAAHCLVTRRAEGITVVAGDHDRDKKEGPEQNRDVEKFVVHEDYNRTNLDNDIALIILKEPVAIDPTVGTVCLPNPDEDIEDILYSGCYITGWGRSEFEGDERFVLQEALLPYVSKEKCDERNINYFGKSQITENMLCAGFDKGKVSGCKGDSGGPFVCKKYIGKWILEGVTSFGSNICDAQHKYTVFAKTRKFMQWIRKQIE